MKFNLSSKSIFLIGCLLMIIINVNAQCDIKPDVCLEDGDIYLKDPCSGVVLTSPTGDCYRITVNSDGSLSTVAIIKTNAGPDQEVCADSPQISLNGTLGDGVLSATWIGGSGTFTPDRTALNAVYIPSTSEISTGFVNFTLSPDNVLSSCDGDDMVSITILPLANVNAGVDITLCEDDATIQLSGSITGSTPTGIWIGGQGVFTPNRSALNVIYSPSLSEINAGIVTLTLSSTGISGPCASVEDQININIIQNAVVNAGQDMIICDDAATVTLSGTVTGIVSSGSWVGGQGTFTPDRNALNAIYTPTQSEILAGVILLTLRSADPAGPCTSVDDEMTISILSNAIDAGVDQAICHDQNVILNPVPLGGTWTGGAGTYNGNTYTPSSIEISTTLTLTYSVQANQNNCIAGSDELNITIFSEPVINPVNDISLCSGEQIQSTIFTGSAGTAFMWTNTHPSIGLPPNGIGNISAFTANNSTASEVISTITVIPYNFGRNGEDNQGLGDDCIGIPITFTITVESNGQGPLFECFKLVQNIQDTNPPSSTFNALHIVNISNNTCTGLPSLTASFSPDPADILRTYGCINIGDIQVTMYIFDIGDSNNDGVIDTTYREACVAIQTVLDPAEFCNL